jgi:hypothetical protein
VKDGACTCAFTSLPVLLHMEPIGNDTRRIEQHIAHSHALCTVCARDYRYSVSRVKSCKHLYLLRELSGSFRRTVDIEWVQKLHS